MPVLEDGDFRLTESSAILKYLADKTGSPAYPKDPQQARARQRADGLVQHRVSIATFRYGFVYPQIFPFMKRPDDVVQAGTLAYGKEKALGWLKVLDQNLHRPAQQLSVRRRDDDCRLPGRRSWSLGGEAIGCDISRLSRTSRAGSAR